MNARRNAAIRRAVACVGVGVALASGHATRSQTRPPDAPPTGAIAGQVVDALNGSPIPKAALRLLASGNPSWPRGGLQAETDAAGRFEFPGLAAGLYSLSVQADGYVSGRYGALSPGDWRSSLIDLRSDEKLTELRTLLWPGARLSGVVTDERGEPAVGLAVHFLRRQYIGARPMWGPSGVAKTDDRGRFASTTSLLPGDYLALLRAQPPSIRESTVAHESVFYGGGRTVASASVITLRAGERREGIDFVTSFTPRTTLVSVSGRITAPEGVRIIGYASLVRRDAEDPIAELEGFRAWLGIGGLFSFSHVPGGDYRLRFVVFPGNTGAASWNGGRTISKPASVADTTWFADLPLSLTKSVTDLDVPLQRAGRIRGRVVFDGRSDAPPVEVLNAVVMYVDPADARDMTPSPSLGIPAGGVDAQGRFETAGLPPGKYVIDPMAVI